MILRRALDHAKRASFLRALAQAALFLGLCGCTEAKQFIALESDYAAYRSTRVGDSLEARVTAASRYLDRHPHGAYVDEVRAYFARAEPFFYQRSEASIESLERYLDALPTGPHAAQAKDALAFARSQGNKPDSLLSAAASTRVRLEANAKSRAYARGELGAWLERVMDPAVFAVPFSRGPKELLVPFSLSLPESHCAALAGNGSSMKQGRSVPSMTARRCTKLLSLPYVIPVGPRPNGNNHGYEEHELTFELAIDMDGASRPLRIEVSGPDMFLRLQETYAKRFEATELETRIEAVERAVDVISGAFEAKVSNEPTCNQDVAAPDVVHLRCHGIDVVGTLGGGADGDDLITVTTADLTPVAP